VQDFTEQQVYLMVHQAHPRYRAVTVVGDLAQKLHHGNSIDLRACFPDQNVPNIQLTENLRQTEAPGLALFSAMFRKHFHRGEPPSPEMCLRARNEGTQVQRPQVINCPRLAEFGSAILYALSQTSPRQTVAVLLPTATMAEVTFKRLENQLREQLIEAELSEKVNLARRHVRHFTDVANAKGLEFDVVVLAHVEAFDLSRAADVNRLYVGVTRARESLTLLSRKSSLTPQLTSLINDFSAMLEK
jgi:DNA helicase IV